MSCEMFSWLLSGCRSLWRSWWRQTLRGEKAVWMDTSGTWRIEFQKHCSLLFIFYHSIVGKKWANWIQTKSVYWFYFSNNLLVMRLILIVTIFFLICKTFGCVNSLKSNYLNSWEISNRCAWRKRGRVLDWLPWYRVTFAVQVDRPLPNYPQSFELHNDQLLWCSYIFQNNSELFFCQKFLACSKCDSKQP